MSSIICRKGFLKIVCPLCAVIVLGVDPLCAGAGKSSSGIRTNFEIIEALSSETAQEIVARIGTLRPDVTVYLNKTKSAGSVDFIMENAFVQRMRDAGIRLAIETPNSDASTIPAGRYRLSYQIVRLSLSYPKISRKWWFASREVSRAAQADIFAQFIDLATGNVMWAKESHAKYNDTIDFSRLKSVEDAQYDFTRPPHSEFKMTRLFEPLVVGGIVVGLVYLFFSNQSD